jgi:membrane fusion protein, multidrug efflux system
MKFWERRHRRAISTVTILAVAVLPLVAGGCGKGDGTAAVKAGQGARKMEFPVEVAAVATTMVEYTITGVGSVEAFETVAVTAQVAGVVEQVRFAEGDHVGAAQVLVEIEPQRYRLQVDSAKAALAKAEAQRRQAQLGLERRRSVNAKNADLVRQEDVDQFETQVAVAAADSAERQAALELAELNLRYAFVKAPTGGVIQSRTVATGQYVQPGTVLATMVRREPLLLRFHVPERDAAPLRSGQALRFHVSGGERSYAATITNVGAAAAASSRMVEVTARVDDPNRSELRPGSFAEASVPVGAVVAAPVVPQTAVRPSERGFLAYVIEDGTARERVLDLGLRTQDGRVEVRSGLVAGEMLVVRGAEALRDGAAVKIAGTSPPAPSP